MNQCDGCRRGAPLKDGVHDLSGTKGSYPGEKMGCTAHRYEECREDKNNPKEPKDGVPSVHSTERDKTVTSENNASNAEVTSHAGVPSGPASAGSTYKYEPLIKRLRYIADTEDARFGEIDRTLREAADVIETLTTSETKRTAEFRTADLPRKRPKIIVTQV